MKDRLAATMRFMVSAHIPHLGVLARFCSGWQGPGERKPVDRRVSASFFLYTMRQVESSNAINTRKIIYF